MDDRKILTINKADGTTEDVEEVISFKFYDTNKRYLVYTKSEIDQNGNVTIYVTEAVNDNMGARFLGVGTDDEWSKIKDVLRQLAKSDSSEEYFVLNKGDLVNRSIVVIGQPKKLKTRGSDYASIKTTMPSEGPSVAPSFEVKEEPVPVKTVQETIKPEINVKKEEPVVEPNIEFAYHAKKEEEKIDEDRIEQIKSIGDTYKGQPKMEFKKPVVPEESAPKKETVSSEDFVRELEKESYSPKTREYKNNIKIKHDQLLVEIENNKRLVSEITREYTDEKDACIRLQEKKDDSQSVIDGVNSLNLEFLVNRNDPSSVTALSTLESLFNTHRQIVLDTNQEIKQCEERKKEIGKKEQAARTEGAELVSKKNKFEEVYYEKLVSINKMDEKARMAENDLTEITGISDISAVSNVNSFDSSSSYNPFDGVRQNVSPEIPSIEQNF